MTLCFIYGAVAMVPSVKIAVSYFARQKQSFVFHVAKHWSKMLNKAIKKRAFSAGLAKARLLW